MGSGVKKVFYAAAFLAALCVPAAADQSAKGKSIITGFVGGGFSSIEGHIPSDYTVEGGFSRTIGASYGYGISDSFMLQCGAEFIKKPFTIESESTKVTQNITLSFVDFSAGLRGFLDNFYGEAGGYYGLRTARQKKKVEKNDISTSSSIPDRDTSDDAGFYLGTGCLFKVKKNIALDLGCRFEAGLRRTYSEADINTRTHNLSIRFGLAFIL